ncbi:MAG: hypothetical protein P8Y36_08015, partial [Alphaproteobacteria bacterium]
DGRFEVKSRFEGETPEGIRRGQTLQIRLELGSELTAVLLPRGGFFQSTGGRWIYIGRCDKVFCPFIPLNSPKRDEISACAHC